MSSSIRLSHLFILVSDLARAREFYVGTLGLQVLMEEPGYLRVGGRGGFHLGIEQGDADQVGAVGVELVLEVDDVDRRYRELIAAGVESEGAPEDQEWGARHAWFRDPDGYRLSIFGPRASVAK